MKKHLQHHRNKFFVVLALFMVVAFLWWMWPVEVVKAGMILLPPAEVIS